MTGCMRCTLVVFIVLAVGAMLATAACNSGDAVDDPQPCGAQGPCPRGRICGANQVCEMGSVVRPDASAGVTTSPVTVVVRDPAGNSELGAPVVAHLPDGSPFGPVVVATTGTAVVNVPTGGIITYATGSGDRRHLGTFTSVVNFTRVDIAPLPRNSTARDGSASWAAVHPGPQATSSPLAILAAGKCHEHVGLEVCTIEQGERVVGNHRP